MDIRTKFIKDFECKLSNKLSSEQIKIVSDELYLHLDKYEIQDRCTDIVPIEEKDSPISVLKNFIVAKNMAGLSEKTLKRYYTLCQRLLTDLGKPIRKITTYDLRLYLTNYKRQRNVSNRTLDGMRNCFSSFFEWCYKNDVIAKNPCSGLEQIKYEKKVRLPYTDSEIEELRNACETIRDRAIIEFLNSTGCRVSEMVALNRNDINFQKHNVIVLGKGSKERTIYINDTALLYLQKYLIQRTDNDPCLFLGKRGRLSKDGIEALLHKIGKKAGIYNVHPHRFRRTFATNMINHGASIQDVASILGHEDIETTQIYCYVDQQNVANSYNKYVY